MFSYLGSKSKIADLYPSPVHNIIVEPFAGSARYSLLHWQKDVRLYDLSKYVVKVWRYLIQATEKEVLSLPDVPSKVHLDNYKQLSQEERWLIGFHLCRGKAKPRSTGHGLNSWATDKIRIASNLHKVRHWKITQLDFAEIPNIKATYFIDPPYKTTQERLNNSDRYEHGKLNYDELAQWVLKRRGQAIVCEGEGATYLPFRVLTITSANTNNRTAKRNAELIFTHSV